MRHVFQILLVVLIASSGFSQKFYGGVDDRWENPANWSPDIPTEESKVVLKSDCKLSTSTYIDGITISQNRSVKLEVSGRDAALALMVNSRIANDALGDGELVISDGAAVECYENLYGMENEQGESTRATLRLKNGGSIHANNFFSSQFSSGRATGMGNFELTTSGGTARAQNLIELFGNIYFGSDRSESRPGIASDNTIVEFAGYTTISWEHQMLIGLGSGQSIFSIEGENVLFDCTGPSTSNPLSIEFGPSVDLRFIAGELGVSTIDLTDYERGRKTILFEKPLEITLDLSRCSNKSLGARFVLCRSASIEGRGFSAESCSIKVLGTNLKGRLVIRL